MIPQQTALTEDEKKALELNYNVTDLGSCFILDSYTADREGSMAEEEKKRLQDIQNKVFKNSLGFSLPDYSINGEIYLKYTNQETCGQAWQRCLEAIKLLPAKFTGNTNADSLYKNLNDPNKNNRVMLFGGDRLDMNTPITTPGMIVVYDNNVQEAGPPSQPRQTSINVNVNGTVKTFNLSLQPDAFNEQNEINAGHVLSKLRDQAYNPLTQELAYGDDTTDTSVGDNDWFNPAEKILKVVDKKLVINKYPYLDVLKSNSWIKGNYAKKPFVCKPTEIDKLCEQIGYLEKQNYTETAQALKERITEKDADLLVVPSCYCDYGNHNKWKDGFILMYVDNHNRMHALPFDNPSQDAVSTLFMTTEGKKRTTRTGRRNGNLLEVTHAGGHAKHICNWPTKFMGTEMPAEWQVDNLRLAIAKVKQLQEYAAAANKKPQRLFSNVYPYTNQTVMNTYQAQYQHYAPASTPQQRIVSPYQTTQMRVSAPQIPQNYYAYRQPVYQYQHPQQQNVYSTAAVQQTTNPNQHQFRYQYLPYQNQLVTNQYQYTPIINSSVRYNPYAMYGYNMLHY